jgi:hypothetical protein
LTSAAFLLPLALASFDAQWAASLAPNAEVKLPAGNYAGPWKLATGVHLVASPGAVLLSGPGADATLELAGDARIEGLAVEVMPGGYGIRVKAGKVELIKVSLKAGTSARAAIYVAHGELEARGGSIDGDVDYGVLTQSARHITLSNETVHARRVGVAAISSEVVVVENCTLTGPFAEAAITLLGVKAGKLSRNRLTAVKTMGIKILNSSVSLTENRVSGARVDSDGLEGSGLYAQASHLTLIADEFGDATDASQGPVVMLLHTTARLEGVKIRGGLQTLLYLAEDAAVTSTGSELRDSPVGLIVESGSSADQRGFEFVNVTRPLMRIKR